MSYTLPEPYLTLQGKSKGKLTGEVMNLFDGTAMDRAYADGFASGAASRDAEVDALKSEIAIARAWLAEADASDTKLRAEIEALRADAESWRKYKARKDAVIAAGMGCNPLRTESQRKSDAFDSLPDDYEVN